MTTQTTFRRGGVMRLMVLATFFATGLISISTTQAALPVIDSLKPLGVVRGEESTITFRGQRVGDAYKVLVDEPGIEILEVKAVNDKQVDVKLKASPTLTPGLYAVRLVTKSGIANLRLIGVGTMPITAEVEPNNDFESPQLIELNTTVDGIVDREDIDHYQIQLKAGQTLNVEIEGIRLGYTLNNQNVLDPYVAILDDRRFEVASNDDSSLLQQDSLCTFTAPADGTYTVLVRDSSFLGSRVGGYRLHVGTFPRPIAAIPAGGNPGSTLRATLIDQNFNATSAEVELPSTTHDRWPVVTENENGISPSPNWIRVNELPVEMEKEPNDDYRKAPTYKVPAAFCGVIEKEQDYDCFTFTGKKGTRYRVETFARHILRSPLDAYVNVFGPDNKTIQSGDDAGGKLDPTLEFTAKADGPHTVRIYDQLRGGSPAHQYRIEVTSPQPTFNLTLKELRRVETHVVPVPSGGSIGMVVTAARRGYSGEIRLDLEGLPKGVTATTFPMPAGRSEIPVLLTAAKGAEHDASLFKVNGRGDDKNFHVVGSFSQLHHLVLGQNRRHMWSRTTDRSTMAVTDEAPFTIELIQPKTPIVQSGSKSLQVKIVRDEGFDGTVSLRTLYNPPGVSINNSRRMSKGQNEVDIPITANSKAGVGTWPLIMIASYSTGSGTRYIATNPIMLDVQPAYFAPKFTKAAGELGTESAVNVSLEIEREYDGQAEVELVGLPKGVTSPAAVQKIDADTKVVTFPLVIAKDARPGTHKTLVCQSRIKVGDELIIQTTGGGEIRVDKPVETKKTPAKPASDKAKKPAAPKALSRLEQLRQNK
tara:strand:+ start:396662 stop:399112 length:2451 start_codon:yes stop_codon:yes gene_type:complete